MKNLTYDVARLTIVLLVTLLIYSCNSKRTVSDDSDSSRLVRQIHDMTPQDSIPLSIIYLDSLTVSDSVFMANKNKNFVFNFLFKDTTITLNGWIMKKTQGGPGQYGTAPDVMLTPLGKTPVAIGPNVFVGNQIITKDVVKAIVDYINSQKAKNNTRQAVLNFYPNKNAAGRIYYEIRIEILGDTIPDMIPAPGFSTNPSPPHQGFD